MKNETQRYWEIDFLRGIAVIMMIAYHIFFDLDFLGIISIPLDHPAFRLFLYPIGTLFLMLVGFSLVLSYQRYHSQNGVNPPVEKYLKRSVSLFSIALLITGLTWLYPHDGFIVFGVIHCISLSILITYFFIEKPMISLVTGLIIVGIGLFFSTMYISNPYLFWMGIKTSSFHTLDYFPLFPWLGVVLIGVYMPGAPSWSAKSSVRAYPTRKSAAKRRSPI